MAAGPDTGYVKNGDVHIAFQVSGDGPIDLLYASGFLTHVDHAWELPAVQRFLGQLGTFARVIRFDRRGVGLSDRLSGPATLEERMEDIASVLDRVGSTETALFGVHEGGPVLAMFAATHPERVRALVLHGSFARQTTSDDYPWGFAPESVEGQEFLTGVRSSVEADRVLVTVLFTDIVGSTQRAVELGDRKWRDLQEAHHGVVRRALERFRGVEVDTAGDGFFATFDGPARAIRCALAICEDVKALGLEIRAGLHTGEVERRVEGVSGIAVHLGARVSALAGASEVLVSRTVADLVAGSGIEFQDRGVHALKGVPGDWQILRVVHQPFPEHLRVAPVNRDRPDAQAE